MAMAADHLQQAGIGQGLGQPPGQQPGRGRPVQPLPQHGQQIGGGHQPARFGSLQPGLQIDAVGTPQALQPGPTLGTAGSGQLERVPATSRAVSGGGNRIRHQETVVIDTFHATDPMAPSAGVTT